MTTDQTNETVAEPVAGQGCQPAKGCLLELCQGEHYCRGLCKRHYQIAWRAVQAGETSWRMIVKAGHATESMRDGCEKERRRLLE